MERHHVGSGTSYPAGTTGGRDPQQGGTRRVAPRFACWLCVGRGGRRGVLRSRRRRGRRHSYGVREVHRTGTGAQGMALVSLRRSWLPSSRPHAQSEAADLIAGGRLQLGISRGSPEQVIDGWRYFGNRPIEGDDDAEMGRRHAEEFLELLRGKGFAQPNLRPMFPNPPGRLRLEPYSEGLRERIWWGSASNATAAWARRAVARTRGGARESFAASERARPDHLLHLPERQDQSHHPASRSRHGISADQIPQGRHRWLESRWLPGRTVQKALSSEIG